MKISVVKETLSTESRIAMTPDIIKKLVALEPKQITVEYGLGKHLYSDQAYENKGAKLADRQTCLSQADIILSIHPLGVTDLEHIKPSTKTISYMDPFMNTKTVNAYAASGITCFSIEMIPRTTLAQKMDALSSQASLAGYVAVLLAANQLPQILPMMTTPAGTIRPSKVFIIGAGVAGLQAIATAKRLGATVEAFDTRPVVKEQVQSLGGKFVNVDLGETGETKDGYAKQLTRDQIKKQQDVMAKHCAMADIVITTAQLFGKKAPIIVTDAMIKAMKPGSVIVDLAVETGGNVEGTTLGKTVEKHGVHIIGVGNFPGKVSKHASQMYASNLYYFIEHFWDKETKTMIVPESDPIGSGALLTKDGQLVNDRIKQLSIDASKG